MKTETLPLKKQSIADIYNDDKATYEIPIYQRNYAWGKDEVSALIQDVYDAYTASKQNYYIGTLVSFHKGDQVYEVIDGQQRLATLLITATGLAQSPRPMAPCVTRVLAVAVGIKYGDGEINVAGACSWGDPVCGPRAGGIAAVGQLGSALRERASHPRRGPHLLALVRNGRRPPRPAPARFRPDRDVEARRDRKTW